MNDKISITFDDENRIRVLEPEKFKDTETMRNESMEFIKSKFFRINPQIRNHFLRRNHLRTR
jgi:Intraflagellar transport complex B, subunit 20